MYKLLSLSFIAIIFSLSASAQLKKDGMPDMRYSSNKNLYGGSSSYSTPSYPSSNYNSGYSTPSYSTPIYSSPIYSTPAPQRNYSNGGQMNIQNGYLKSNGTYVSPHFKTSADNYKCNNLKW